MAGKTGRYRLILSDEDKAELEQLARSRTVPHREAQRAAILLGYHGGESIAGIGRRLGMTRLSVVKWVAKALAVGPMAALKDNYHRPKEPVIGDDAKAWVVHVACSKPLVGNGAVRRIGLLSQLQPLLGRGKLAHFQAGAAKMVRGVRERR